MESATLDLVRSLYAAWQRGDYRSIDWADPDIEWAMVDGPTPGSWRGVAGLVEGLRDVTSEFEGWRVEPEKYRELDERVLVVFRVSSGRGKTSGFELKQISRTGATLFHIRGGR